MSYVFAQQYVFMAWWLIKHKDNFTFSVQMLRVRVDPKSGMEVAGKREIRALVSFFLYLAPSLQHLLFALFSKNVKVCNEERVGL